MFCMCAVCRPRGRSLLFKTIFWHVGSAVLLINATILTAISFAAVSLGWINTNASLWIYGSIAFTGVARAFIASSYTTLFALIIPHQHFAKAMGIGSSVFQIGLVLDPVLGGLLVGFANKTIAYQIAVLLCAGAALAMLSLKIKEPPPVQNSPAVFASIAQGLRFVFSNQIILGALSLDMFAVLFGGAVAMLPAFIQDIYSMLALNLLSTDWPDFQRYFNDC